jgi:hypothetical protein
MLMAPAEQGSSFCPALFVAMLLRPSQVLGSLAIDVGAPTTIMKEGTALALNGPISALLKQS